MNNNKEGMKYVGSINLDRIDQSRLFQGKTGRWLNLYLFPAPKEPGKLLVKQSVTQEERQSGVETEILGDIKPLQARVQNGDNQSDVFGEEDKSGWKPVQPKNEHPKHEDYDPPF